MLYVDMKKEALAICEKAVKRYNEEYENMECLGRDLYDKRLNSVTLICEVEFLVNSIANCTKEFDKQISGLQAERECFYKTANDAKKALNDAVEAGKKAPIKTGVEIVAGVAGGTAVAAISPTAAMWVATTFGTASTGTAISTLSGAAATKAALAWLGGGVLAQGGLGVAGGQALLALAGPIGWGITGVSTVASVILLGYKNKQIADKAIAEAKKITIAGAAANEASAKIRHLTDETVVLMDALRKLFQMNRSLHCANYQELSEDEQYRLGTMVNNTLALAKMLNQTI